MPFCLRAGARFDSGGCESWKEPIKMLRIHAELSRSVILLKSDFSAGFLHTTASASDAWVVNLKSNHLLRSSTKGSSIFSDPFFYYFSYLRQAADAFEFNLQSKATRQLKKSISWS